MGVIRKLRSLLPLPSKWAGEERTFGMKVENAYAEIQTMTKIVEYTYNYSAAATTTVNLSMANFKVSTPKGFTPVGIAYVYTGNVNVSIDYINPNGETISSTKYLMGVRNTTSTARNNITARVGILYMNAGFVNK